MTRITADISAVETTIRQAEALLAETPEMPSEAAGKMLQILNTGLVIGMAEKQTAGEICIRVEPPDGLVELIAGFRQ